MNTCTYCSLLPLLLTASLLMKPAAPKTTSIVSPSPDSILESGAEVTFTVRAPRGTEKVVLLAPGMVANDVLEPFEITATIPDIAGVLTVSALSVVGTETDFAEDVTYSVVPAAPLVSLSLEPQESAVDSGTTRLLSVTGFFEDGKHREINTLPGVVYQATPEGVVTVDSDGTVRAVAPGEVIIRAIFGDLQASATWFVTEEAKN